jgi:hypothetical protein
MCKGRLFLPFLFIVQFFGLISYYVGLSQSWKGPIKVELGSEETVFEYTKDHCVTLDLPDVYARAIRTSNGIVLVSGNAPENYFMFGKDFNSLERICAPVLVSGDKWEVEAFDHQEWITTVFSEGVDTIYALIHNEYHDPYSRRCKQGVTDPSNPCWYNLITFAKSTDGGKSFTQPPSPSHIVAMLPFKWNPEALERGAPPPHGYFEPSNIIKKDGYYYCIFFAILSNTDPTVRGTCLMRTDDISNPSSWKIWDGQNFSISFVNPYIENIVDSSKYLPAFISKSTINDLRGSLTWNSLLKQFLMIGAGVFPVNGETKCGFFLSRSDDLIHWSQPQLIKETILGWAPCDVQTPEQAQKHIIQEAYPSLIDHNAPDINFTVTDSSAYLYYVQNMDNHSNGGWGFRRNLVRVPLTIRKVGDTPQKKALLEPENGKVYHGACLMTYESAEDPIGPYLSALNDSSLHPAVRSFFFTIPGERGPDNTLKGLMQFLKSADSIGFIPELSLFFMDKNGATDSIIATSSIHDWIIDSIITLCKNYGKRMFVRIGGEFNGSGQGWNGGGYHPHLYVKLFKKVVDKFSNKGFRDSIATVWCYEPDAPNDFDSVDSQGALWYPGDEYVDWFGLDVFDTSHFDQSLPNFDRRGITKKGKSERFLALARNKAKPVYLNETSAKGINITPDSLDGINDWNSWFKKFFEFIDSHEEIKGFNYINALWPQNAYPGWGDARIQNNKFIISKYVEKLKEPKYIHLSNLKATGLDTIPLTDLGTNKWKGYQGGLYPNGSNLRPNKHNTDGINLANSIEPLDVNGNSDPNGKIVLLSIGMSNCTQEFQAFKAIADTFSLKNPNLILVDGAQGGQTASIISDPNANFWNVVSQRLSTSGVSEKQVQVVWLKEANANPKEEFPEHAIILKDQLKKIALILKKKFPNLKLCYVSSRTYGGYATTTLNPEPYAYESGFSVKWLIEEQINGDTLLTYNGENPNAPWLCWGPYLWAKGSTPRSDGLTWERDDFGPDGTHPSAQGRLKVANMLLKFFTTDETATPWFLKHPLNAEDKESENDFLIYPNPANTKLFIYQKNTSSLLRTEIIISNLFGEVVFRERQASTLPITIDVSNLPDGIYCIRINNKAKLFTLIR